jgi:thiol-disulfide isomerase/thioredoxin
MKLQHTAAALIALSSAAMAEGKLKIGDPAPPIKTAEWVQGEAVKELAKGTVYVVEFWATWCGPCVATIPHLDELHEELKDSGVVFIGQNCWERDLAKVKPFVTKMGEKMSYRVATDDTSSESKGYMAVNWMQAAGQNGIPAAFVVGKDGKIAWIGHPGGLEADMLKQVVAGTFDSSKAAAEMEAKEAAQATLQKASQTLNKAMKEKDWATATTTLDELEKNDPSMAPRLVGARLMIAVEKGDSAGVAKLVDKMADGPAGNSPEMMNQLARTVATKLKDPTAEALTAATKAAEKGLEKGDANGALYDTLARLQFMQGKKDAAVSRQEKAVEKASGKSKDKFQENLDAYKKGNLPAAE